MRLPTTDPQSAGAIDVEQVKKMVDLFIEKGFIYFDTAWMYCGFQSEPTIGVILCSQKGEVIVKYSVLNDAQQVFASRYRFALPTAGELQREIERRRIEEQEGRVCGDLQNGCGN